MNTRFFISMLIGLLLGLFFALSNIILLQKTSVVAGIVPHHLVAGDMIEDFFEHVISKSTRRIVLLSPEHWGRATHSLTTTGKDTFMNFKVDGSLLETLKEELGENRVSEDDYVLSAEHGITGLVPFIEKNNPDVRFLPIAISQIVDRDLLDQLADTLYDELDSEKDVLIASNDFSHYLPSEVADVHDATSISKITSFEDEAFESLELDCWQCLYVVSKYAEQKGALQTEILQHSNAAKAAGKIEIIQDTTSHMTVVYTQGKRNPIEITTMIFVGDVALPHDIAEKIATNIKVDYFASITQLLRGHDIVSGNLEGPIFDVIEKDPESFSFSPDVTKILHNLSFNLLQLGNNHSKDYGVEGYNSTKKLLTEDNIEFVEYNSRVEKDGYVFYSLNLTDAGADISNAIEDIQNEQQPVIVNVHWGIELNGTSTKEQQETAHTLIDAGADLIIGHHPHVVQEIEEYKGKVIFYSLGNFVFDQRFMKETTEGLAVEVVDTKENTTLTLVPISIYQGVPFVMERKNWSEWLQKLASKSTKSLEKQIQEGIIQTNLH